MKRILFFVLLLAFGFAGCEREGPAERAGEEIDETMEETGDRMEETAEGVEEATD
jgi:hypothetical protein